MSDFKFSLGQNVKISVSGETGAVISRAQHQNSSDQYSVRYCRADGSAIESWWDVEALEPA